MKWQTSKRHFSTCHPLYRFSACLEVGHKLGVTLLLVLGALHGSHLAHAQPNSQTTPTEKPAADKPADQKPAAEKPAAEKAVADDPTQKQAAPFSQATLDGILVTVGDEVILLSDLQKAVNVASDKQTRLLPQGRLSGGALNPTDANQLLDQLIDQRVLTLKVKEMSLNVGDDELEGEIQTFLKNQNISREKFEELLKAEGESVESHREEFRTQLETQRFIGRMIRPLVTVTDDEVRNFYLQQVKRADTVQKVRLRSLVVQVPEGMSESQRQSKQAIIANVKKEIDSGADFTGLVKLYSESPDALKTEGLLPAKPLKELPAEVRERIKDLKTNSVVGPVTLGSSVFFFQFVSGESDDLSEFGKEKAQWETKLLEIKFRERLSEFVKAERSKTKIVKRAIAFSR